MQTSKKDQKKDVKEYDQQEFAPCDIKLILLGDSAVGKSKYFMVFLTINDKFLTNLGWSRDSFSIISILF